MMVKVTANFSFNKTLGGVWYFKVHWQISVNPFTLRLWSVAQFIRQELFSGPSPHVLTNQWTSFTIITLVTFALIQWLSQIYPVMVQINIHEWVKLLSGLRGRTPVNTEADAESPGKPPPDVLSAEPIDCHGVRTRTGLAWYKFSLSPWIYGNKWFSLSAILTSDLCIDLWVVNVCLTGPPQTH